MELVPSSLVGIRNRSRASAKRPAEFQAGGVADSAPPALLAYPYCASVDTNRGREPYLLLGNVSAATSLVTIW